MKLLYIDLFCGAGGTSTGVEKAQINGEKIAKVIACVNHDAKAIASHAANHPDALHFTEDIRTLDLTDLVVHIKKMKSIYPDALVVLWASLECTNFSKAKGGLSRDPDSRTLAEHLYRYVNAINPDYIQIENVEEFLTYGPIEVVVKKTAEGLEYCPTEKKYLDKKKKKYRLVPVYKPIEELKGTYYREWVNRIKSYNYDYDYRIINAADLGAYTSRKRFFGIFAKQTLPIVFPRPTHSKKPEKDLFNTALKPWKAVREVLDFSDEGESIFGRKKPLVDATLERIYSGLIKFVAGGKDIVKYNSMSKSGKYQSPGIDDPCPTISTQNRIGLAQVNFLSKYFSGSPDGKNISIDEPAGTITTKDHHSFISAYYGNGHNHSVNEPSPTVTTKDRLSLISTEFIDQQFGTGKPVSIEKPLGTITTIPKCNLVSCKRWIMNTNFSNVGASIDEPAQTITANRKWHYLMNPQFKSSGGSIDKPCFTLIARMDKMPPYLINTETGNVNITIKPTDSPAMIKIKEFMLLYGIIDIKMRMLRIPELKQIMGFPKDYILIGSQADQKKFIGNAVETTVACALCKALGFAIKELQEEPMAI